MNTKTKDHLIKFIEGVEKLTMSCLHDIGTEEATDILNRCRYAKVALEHDETVVEVR